jgi:glycosyltransferase involved in cell wall biosynthesis
VMRIGLLMNGVDRPLTGVTRVALELGRALRRSGECEVVFLTPYRHGPFRDEAGTVSQYLPGCSRVPGLMILGGPMIAVAARRMRLDLVHDPVGVSPFTLGRWAGRFRRVVAVHDAIAFRYPEGYAWLNNFLHRRFVPATVANVDAVITGSDHARADVARFLEFPPSQTYVVPYGVSAEFRPIREDVAARVAASYGLSRPFVLWVGVRQARKNLVTLVSAFAGLHRILPTHQLALVGPSPADDDGLWRQVRDLGLTHEVVQVGHVPDGDLPAIYSAAELFAFPSLYEGFGLPVIEAMACGTPVVCSNATSLPEVAGGAALLVDPTNVGDLCDAMRRVLTEPAQRDLLRERGLARAMEFSWDRAARATLDVYRQVLERAPRPSGDRER